MIVALSTMFIMGVLGMGRPYLESARVRADLAGEIVILFVLDLQLVATLPLEGIVKTILGVSIIVIASLSMLYS